MDREALGKLVRATWVAWAREQPDPKDSWLVPWEELSEPDREVDRRIGEAVRDAVTPDERQARGAVPPRPGFDDAEVIRRMRDRELDTFDRWQPTRKGDDGE